MPLNAKVLNATQQVLEYGSIDYTTAPGWNGATMTQVPLADGASPPITNGVEVPLKYVKVSGGQLVEMNQTEKDLVDSLTPSSAVQRITAGPEQTVNAGAGGADTTTGWASVIGGMKTSRFPLIAGDWQLVVSLELALQAAGNWNNAGPDRAAQARLLWNGSEIATWVWPHPLYTGFGTVMGATLAEGVKPTIDIQLRRWGSAGVARIRRVRFELAPTTGGVVLT